jgi:hypothetical protein
MGSGVHLKSDDVHLCRRQELPGPLRKLAWKALISVVEKLQVKASPPWPSTRIRGRVGEQEKFYGAFSCKARSDKKAPLSKLVIRLRDGVKPLAGGLAGLFMICTSRFARKQGRER